MSAIRSAIIAAGVKNLKKFGYPGVTESNILADRIYRAFFRKMLEDRVMDCYRKEASANDSRVV